MRLAVQEAMVTYDADFNIACPARIYDRDAA